MCSFKKLLFFICLIAITKNAYSQTNMWHNEPNTNKGLNQRDSLFFSLESSFFFINNEFFGDIIEGYTLPGHIVEPALVYNVGNILNLKAGVNVSKFYGNNESIIVRPAITARLKFSENLELLMGKINGNVKHNLLDPLFFNEQKILNPVENGFQLLFNTEKLWFDAWMSWEQYIRHGDTIPEIFTTGISARRKLTDSSSKWNVTMPVQLMAYHVGGQISNFNIDGQSIINGAIGLEAMHLLPGSISGVGGFAHALFYKDLNEANLLELYSGSGFYGGAIIEASNLKISAAYWHAKNFVSPRGNPMFFSQSLVNPSIVYSDRQMAVGKFLWSKHFTNDVVFSFMAETYYDIPLSFFDYGVGMMLSFSPNIFIGRFPANQ
jgi:hypothetical protein